MTSGLTRSQIDFFNVEGYLVIDDLLDSADLQPVIDEYSQLIEARAQRCESEGKLAALHTDEPFDRRLVPLAVDLPEIAQSLDIMQVRGSATFNFLRHPRILDAAESLVGSEILCNPIQHIRAVLPHHQTGAKPTPWHQDVGVCWPDADPYFMLTMWIPLVDVSLHNGCLEVLPGSHKLGLCRHAHTPYGLDIPPEDRPDLEPTPLPVPAGGAILFHNYTLHHARPNETETVRWSFDLRYHDAYQPTGRPYYPAFLFRSLLRPESVEASHENWSRRWAFALEASKGAKAYRW